MPSLLDVGDVPASWSLFLTVSLVLAVVLGIVLPASVAGAHWSYYWNKKQVDVTKLKTHESYDATANLDSVENEESIGQETGCPKLEQREWTEAGQISDSPWSFEGCEDLSAALDRIWRAPLCTELQDAFVVLKHNVKNIRVARIDLPADNEVFFSIIYQLNTGAELFGGAPSDNAVGFEFSECMTDDEGDAEGATGLRRRGGGTSTKREESGTEGSPFSLPCLTPFYCIHDGFGVLMNTKHLPLLMTHPGDSAHGSCFYVYPSRGLEPAKRLPYLVKFARVDKDCVACADARQKKPSVTYVERAGNAIEDDESLISFIGDTVSNVAGTRVVPPSYLGGPGSQPPPQASI